MTKDTLTTRDKVQYGLIGIIVLGGAFIIGRKIILNSRSNSEEQKTFDSGSTPASAKQIKMAFENDGWWGTDVEALREAIRGIASKEDFVKVMNSYSRLYNRTLMRDLQDELKTTEYNEILAIIAAKPDSASSSSSTLFGPTQYLSWAQRLKAAFDIHYGPLPGTDEEAIRSVFLEIPSQYIFQQVAITYKQTYGTDLNDDLKGELEFWEYESMMSLIKNKP